MIKLGMIGAGGIAQSVHAKALQTLSREIEVIAVSDVNKEAAEGLAEKVGASDVFTDYRQLLKIHDLDAVLITTPNFLHATIAVEALESGKHVLCEKPLAIDSMEAMEMVQVAKEQGKILMTALNNRYRDDISHLKTRIDQGELGDIYHAKCGWVRRAGIPGWGGWFTNQTLSGGGPLIDLGVHMLDVTLYLMGDPKVIAVSGATYRQFGDKSHSRTWGVADPNGVFTVEDYATGFLRLENGATIQLDTSWAANIEKESIYLHLLGNQSGLKLTNESGITLFKEHNGHLYDEKVPIGFDDHKARVNMWKHFATCVETNQSPLSSGERGYALNQMIEALYLSSQEQREIRLV